MVRRARLRSTAVRCLECRNGGGAQPARHLIERDGCGERRGVGAQDAGNSGGTISLYAFDPLNMGTTLFSAPAGSWIPASGTGRMGQSPAEAATGRLAVLTLDDVTLQRTTSLRAMNA